MVQRRAVDRHSHVAGVDQGPPARGGGERREGCDGAALLRPAVNRGRRRVQPSLEVVVLQGPGLRG
eukprot:1141425-Rhodomonas_salina.1